MKLLVCIVRDDFAPDVNLALNKEGMTVTRISTTGGFWRRGNVTMLIGVDEDHVDEALELIDSNAGPEIESDKAPKSHPPSRATIFVLDAEDFERY